MSTRRAPRLLFALIVLAMVALNLRLRLTPFDFGWAGRIPWERITLAPLTMRDVPLNILFFAPLGFGLAGLLAGRGAAANRPRAVAGGALLIGVLFSAALEAAQLFLPERVPSLADVIANGLGTLLGVALFHAWATGIGRALERTVTRRNVLIGLSLYVLGAALLTGYLNHSVRLDNWDDSFPLVVGNEAVGKREWSGRLIEVEVRAGLPDSPDFVARYNFRGPAPFADTSGADAPPLEWREGPAGPPDGQGVHVGPGEWLATAGAFEGFSDAARRADAFVIRATVATADPKQRGPARIVSISADANRRNVTLGQEKDALIVRLRTPAGGENGQKPEVLVPGVFGDGRTRAITVSYDAPMLRVWVDDEAYALSLGPGAAFFPGFVSENRWPVTMDGNPHRYDWAYWGIVVGLAAVVFGGLWAARVISTRRARRERPAAERTA